MENVISIAKNDHPTTLLRSLTVLRDKQLYTDATLTCDGKFYRVHRLVLATYSDYFNAIFERTTCNNPMIVLADVRSEVLESLLDFMYTGETSVKSADLDYLLKGAEYLRIKDLTVPRDELQCNLRKVDNINLSMYREFGSPQSKHKKIDVSQDGEDAFRPNGENSRLQKQCRLSSFPPQNDLYTYHFPKKPSEVNGQNIHVNDALEDMFEVNNKRDYDLCSIHNDLQVEIKDEPVWELSVDLSHITGQANDFSYSPSVSWTSFQSYFDNCQRPQVQYSNPFTEIGFLSQTPERSQSPPLPEMIPFSPHSFSSPLKNDTTEKFKSDNGEWNHRTMASTEPLQILSSLETFPLPQSEAGTGFLSHAQEGSPSPSEDRTHRVFLFHTQEGALSSPKDQTLKDNICLAKRSEQNSFNFHSFSAPNKNATKKELSDNEESSNQTISSTESYQVPTGSASLHLPPLDLSQSLDIRKHMLIHSWGKFRFCPFCDAFKSIEESDSEEISDQVMAPTASCQVPASLEPLHIPPQDPSQSLDIRKHMLIHSWGKFRFCPFCDAFKSTRLS